MSSRKLTVEVRRRGVGVDVATDRRVRRRPDGLSGVVYGGDVYPLRHGAAGTVVIDLDDAGVAKSLCPSFVASTQPLVFVEVAERPAEDDGLYPEKWSIESNRYGHYVVFDGDELFAEDLVERLEESDFTVKRWGASTRPAADGYFYDWFVRLDFDGTADECRAEVAESLSGSLAARVQATVAESAAITERLTALSSIVSRLVEASDARTAELDATKEEASQLRSELALMKGELAAERRSGASLRAELERVQAGRMAATEREMTESLRAAEANAAEWQQLAVGAEEEKHRLEEELQFAQNELQEAQERNVVAATTSSRRRNSVRESALHRRAWNRIVLDDSVLEILENTQECRDPRDLWAIVQRLERRDGVRLKRYSGQPAVREVDEHLATGTPGIRDRVRVYVREHEDRLVLFAHRKGDEKDQDRFVQRIADVDLAELVGP